jgi:ATP/maltotriose-dependent transcriptional regulator MalT
MPHRDKILLQTKLNRPPITRGLIDRPRLFAQLSSSIDHPLTLICAPAGYGKTNRPQEWTANPGGFTSGFGWYSLFACFCFTFSLSSYKKANK